VRYPGGGELPDRQQEVHRRAVRLQWISVAYWISIIVLLYFTLGQSQAMKAAWVEDILGLFPPVAFLIAARFRKRAPTERFPWGYHRAISVAYVVATLALFVLGLFLLLDSAEKLITGVHPPIPLVEILGHEVWLGYLMMGALVYGVIPPVILGHKKQKLAAQLHDKVLFADAKMNRADWMTASAAILGVAGIGAGLWWADAVAAIVISLDILHDGVRYLRAAVSELMDEAPTTYDETGPDPVVEEVRTQVTRTSWVRESIVRAREEGHMLNINVLAVPDGEITVERVERLIEKLRRVHWRVHDVTVTPVARIEGAPEALESERR
jgi:cation diffusion facilitator family transporter